MAITVKSRVGRKKTGSPYGAFALDVRARGLDLADILESLSVRSILGRSSPRIRLKQLRLLRFMHANDSTGHLAALDAASRKNDARAHRRIQPRSPTASSRIVAREQRSSCTKPTVSDEIARALPYYESALFEAVPRLYRDLADGLSQAYETKIAARDLPTIVRFGSWIGGDGDGNPNVTRQTRCARRSTRARSLIARHYSTQASRHLGGRTPSYRTRARIRTI